MTPLLEVQDLVMHFRQGAKSVVKAVNGVSFVISPGEALALVGESGSGKTTVGRSLLRLIEPTGGRVAFLGQDITAMPVSRFRSAALPPADGVPGAVRFVEPAHARWTHCRENRCCSLVKVMRAGGASVAWRHVSLVGLPPSAGTGFPHQFSAGEQQRIGIARAIATRPDLVVLDEPTSALDVSVRAGILALLDDLRRKLNLAYLFISHDLAAVQRVCQRVAIMYLGRIVETGATDELFAQPKHPYSRALLSSALFPDPKRTVPRFLLERGPSRVRSTCQPAATCTSAALGPSPSAPLRRQAWKRSCPDISFLASSLLGRSAQAANRLNGSLDGDVTLTRRGGFG